MNRLFVTLLIFTLALTVIWTQTAQSETAAYTYFAPLPNAKLVNAETTLGIRHGDNINPDTLSATLFTVTGSVSGSHSGHTLLALDNKTIIFEPDTPFAASETVTVTLTAGVETTSGTVLDTVDYSFTISDNPVGRQSSNHWFDTELQPAGRTNQAPTNQTQYKTAPPTLPEISVETPANDTDEGLIFLANFTWGQFDPVDNYLMIIEETGELVYYKNIETSFPVDFFPRENNHLAYGQFNTVGYYIMDETYTVVEHLIGANGYGADSHELLLTPNGHAIYMIYDSQLVDMSQIVPGGDPAANVIGLVLHELDADRNVIFEWRSWDHFEITDAADAIDLTASTIDYAHGNSIDVDTDGNWLISSRTMDEITKINRNTSDIIWRMGGKNNQFDFGDDPSFFHQHDARRLPNGNMSLFDNRTTFGDYSRYIEYELDETNLTATIVREFRTDPDTFTIAMGNGQTLPNGNVMVGWGSSATGSTLTEIKPDGSIALELDMTDGSENPAFGEVSYRALRYPWEGIPETPVLTFGIDENGEAALFFSANGMTSREEYVWMVSCELADGSTQNFTVQTSGFESSYPLGDMLTACAAWEVTALNTVSNASYTSDTLIPNRIFMPLLEAGG